MIHAYGSRLIVFKNAKFIDFAVVGATSDQSYIAFCWDW